MDTAQPWLQVEEFWLDTAQPWLQVEGFFYSHMARWTLGKIIPRLKIGSHWDKFA